MLRSVKALSAYAVQAIDDGETGPIHAFLFNDQDWGIRYLAVEMGNWFLDRKVLIAPSVLGQPNWSRNRLPVSLTREQVESSPTLDIIRPYSRQMESIDVATVGVPVTYPGGAFFPVPMGLNAAHIASAEQVEQQVASEVETPHPDDPHLRSTYEVTGYSIQARDGNVGHVEDFIINDQTWMIQYIVVDTQNWLPGGDKVLLAPTWLETINWAARQVHVNLSRETIRNSPKYKPEQSPLADMASRLVAYYKKIGT